MKPQSRSPVRSAVGRLVIGLLNATLLLVVAALALGVVLLSKVDHLGDSLAAAASSSVVRTLGKEADELKAGLNRIDADLVALQRQMKSLSDRLRRVGRKNAVLSSEDRKAYRSLVEALGRIDRTMTQLVRLKGVTRDRLLKDVGRRIAAAVGATCQVQP